MNDVEKSQLNVKIRFWFIFSSVNWVISFLGCVIFLISVFIFKYDEEMWKNIVVILLLLCNIAAAGSYRYYAYLYCKLK